MKGAGEFPSANVKLPHCKITKSEATWLWGVSAFGVHYRLYFRHLTLATPPLSAHNYGLHMYRFTQNSPVWNVLLFIWNGSGIIPQIGCVLLLLFVLASYTFLYKPDIYWFQLQENPSVSNERQLFWSSSFIVSVSFFFFKLWGASHQGALDTENHFCAV